MKAISLWQPWASLWLSPRKVDETRHWSINHRGWIAVHAAKRFEKNDHPSGFADILRAEFGSQWFRSLPTGAIIGRVFLTACLRTENVYPDHCPYAEDNWWCGNFEPGRFAWRRSEYDVLATPVPYRGAQGVFEVPDSVFATRTTTGDGE